MTAEAEELDRLRRQNAQLFRTLLRIKQERDTLQKQLENIHAEKPSPKGASQCTA